MSTRRFRLRYVFWLDMNKSDEATIAEQIETLKSERSFASTIRDGIRLISDLRAGQVDVLFELFPWVRTALMEQAQPQETPNARALQEQLARIEHQLLAQGNKPINLPAKGQGSRVNLNDPLPELSIFTQGSGASAEETREVFVADMGDLFGSDDDMDIWD